MVESLVKLINTYKRYVRKLKSIEDYIENKPHEDKAKDEQTRVEIVSERETYEKVIADLKEQLELGASTWEKYTHKVKDL